MWRKPCINQQVQVDAARLLDENLDLRSLMLGAKLVRNHKYRIVPDLVTQLGEIAK
jgi:hypothetical protein